ncbi:MAG: pentapeptide repeat-containing protein [Clostridia bacterium]|nr:pentapeptide repeat-containing protein [Clostridia bacterium]
MQNELTNYRKLIPSYFDDEYNAVTEELISHMKNKEYFLHDRQIIYQNTSIEVNYSTKNLNQAYFINCIFRNCNFESASFVNSKFIKCKFISCNLKSVNFHGSLFEEVYFDNKTEMLSTKCGKCQFFNSVFDSEILDSVIFDDTTFYNCAFNNSTWYAVSVDLCLFKNTNFKQIKFRNMNLEFSIFDNIHMNNMKLPFPTIPYIYGAFHYLQSTNDNIRVTSQLNIKNGISKEEYLSLLDKLEIYYAYSNNYFPLANIYLAKKDVEKCKSAVIVGMEKAIIKKDLRSIEDLARFISLNSLFKISERYELLSYILSKLSYDQSSIETTNRVNQCINNLRTLFFKPVNKCSSFHLSVKTNINKNDQQVAFFIGVLEKIINSINCSKQYNIEIKHNSPYEFFINLFSDYESVCGILGALILTLKGTDIVINKVINYINSIQSIKNQSLENQKLKQEIELNEIEKQQKNYDLKECKEKALKNNIDIDKKNITVGDISYVIISEDEENVIIQPSNVLH